MTYASNYAKAVAVIFGVYGLQMLAIPGNMVTDHWDMPSTPGMEFWIRGHGVSALIIAYLMMNATTDVAAKAGFALALGIGIIYPFNAKFGYLTPDLPLKYPMHYVPEALMATLTLAGIPAIMAGPDPVETKKA